MSKEEAQIIELIAKALRDLESKPEVIKYFSRFSPEFKEISIRGTVGITALSNFHRREFEVRFQRP